MYIFKRISEQNKKMNTSNINIVWGACSAVLLCPFGLVRVLSAISGVISFFRLDENTKNGKPSSLRISWVESFVVTWIFWEHFKDYP